jgi:hypothetical protein
MMLQRPRLSLITASLMALLATTDTAYSFSVSRVTTTTMTATAATANAPSLPIPVPRIIQGGMGIRISSWELARTVSQKGELGVVSGTSIDTILVRTLQNGMYTTALCVGIYVVFTPFRRTVYSTQRISPSFTSLQ